MRYLKVNDQDCTLDCGRVKVGPPNPSCPYSYSLRSQIDGKVIVRKCEATHEIWLEGRPHDCVQHISINSQTCGMRHMNGWSCFMESFSNSMAKRCLKSGDTWLVVDGKDESHFCPLPALKPKEQKANRYTILKGADK